MAIPSGIIIKFMNILKIPKIGKAKARERYALDCVHTLLHIMKMVTNVTDTPSVPTKTAYFRRAEFENGKFQRRNSNRHILETSSREYSKTLKN